MTRCLAPESITYKPHPIDWDGWAEERQKYGAYKEPLNQKGRSAEQISGSARSRCTITHNGKTQTPKQWCEELGLTMAPKTFWHRIAILGWSFDKAVSTPLKHAFYTYQGQSKSMLAWSRELGISNSTLQYRLQIMKLPVEKAFAPAKNYKSKRFITYKGETKTFLEWSQILGFSNRTLYNRIHTSGWDTEKAFTTPLRSGKLRRNHD